MTFETRDCRERISRSPGGIISTEFNHHPEFELFAESSISAIVGIALFFIGKTFANILFNVFFSTPWCHTHPLDDQRKVKCNYQFINQWVTESEDNFAMHGRKAIAEKYKK